MKILILVSAMLAATLGAHAGDRNPEADLVRAITLCAAPNNPMQDGLLALKGNLFQRVESSEMQDANGTLVITAVAVHSLNALNRAVMAPDRTVGKIRVETGYDGGKPFDRPLFCRLTVVPQ